MNIVTFVVCHVKRRRRGMTASKTNLNKRTNDKKQILSEKVEFYFLSWSLFSLKQYIQLCLWLEDLYLPINFHLPSYMYLLLIKIRRINIITNETNMQQSSNEVEVRPPYVLKLNKIIPGLSWLIGIIAYLICIWDVWRALILNF